MARTKGHSPANNEGPSAAELLRPDPEVCGTVVERSDAPPEPARPLPEPVWIAPQLPTAPFDECGCRPFHIEARLTPKQMRGLQRLRNGLDLVPTARDPQGRRINSYADVIRWLLETVAESAGEK